MVDDAAPMDDLHDHPDFDIHVTRQGGRVQVVVWLFGTRHELREVHATPSDETPGP